MPFFSLLLLVIFASDSDDIMDGWRGFGCDIPVVSGRKRGGGNGRNGRTRYLWPGRREQNVIITLNMPDRVRR